jgi:hypothetical protein
VVRKLSLLTLVLSKWIPSYVIGCLEKKEKPIHIIFCMVDHFEPGNRNAPLNVERDSMKVLLSKYPLLADKHKDFYGNRLKRSWFFPPHDHRNCNLKDLVSLCEKGYGEIELHLHHGKTHPDTGENLEKTILQCIEEYGYFGIFGTENGRKRYGFIHGDWALNNSLNGKYCGVNNEIEILSRTGCYADFTFPSLMESNPNQINSIYYANNNSNNPQSYKRGHPVSRFASHRGDLMIIQGPLYPFFLHKGISGLRYVGDVINGKPPVSNKRIDFWVKTGIHVRGKNNWILIKTHTHGATATEAVLGEEMDNICNYLESKYNDGEEYVLHYVTARELYNIIKAVEAGEPGTNPEDYRSYRVAPPCYDATPEISGASNILDGLIARTYEG